MDLESVSDELYALLPAEFTATRDARARTARREGDRELADRVGALRKPTLAAWAANLLVHTAPDETGRFLALGEELRRAHRDLDGSRLRELARTQRQLVAALSRAARAAAAEAGQPIGDSAQREVEQTLHAVLADAGAAGQWSAGHLTRPLRPPSGFTTDLRAVPTGTRASAAAEGRKPARTTPGTPRPGTRRRRDGGAGGRDSGGGGHRAAEGGTTELDKARERRRERAEEAAEARRAAGAAAEEARRRTDARDAADEDLTRAKDRRKAADARLRAARDEVRDAEREQRAATDAEREARDRAQDAAHAAREADRAARRATERADRLDSRRTKR